VKVLDRQTALKRWIAAEIRWYRNVVSRRSAVLRHALLPIIINLSILLLCSFCFHCHRHYNIWWTDTAHSPVQTSLCQWLSRRCSDCPNTHQAGQCNHSCHHHNRHSTPLLPLLSLSLRRPSVTSLCHHAHQPTSASRPSYACSKPSTHTSMRHTYTRAADKTISTDGTVSDKSKRWRLHKLPDCLSFIATHL